MNPIELMRDFCRRSRERTLGLLAKVEAEPDPQAALGFQPGPGRAHIAWQLMHIGITEELFATERLLPGAQPAWPDLVARFKGGSTPDDDIPTPRQIRDLLAQSRAHLEATLAGLPPEQLDDVPVPLQQRGRKLRDVLAVIGWHEAHHQGQAHLTFNLYKARPQ